MNDDPNWITFLPIFLVMAIGICTPFVIMIVALVFVRRRKMNAETKNGKCINHMASEGT
jgi:predicted membrane chloride channel (bestrophin family)